MRVFYENIAYHNIINILFFKHLIAILIILRAPYSVRFPNPTPNVIKSQINKRNIIVYFILLLFLLALGVGFRAPTPHLRSPNTKKDSETKHHKKFRDSTQ